MLTYWQVLNWHSFPDLEQSGIYIQSILAGWIVLNTLELLINTRIYFVSFLFFYCTVSFLSIFMHSFYGFAL